MTKDSFNRKKNYSNTKIIQLDPLTESLNKAGMKGGAAKSILGKNFKKSAKQAYKENKKFKVKNTLFKISKAGQKDLRQQSFANKLFDKVLPKINKEISKGGKNISKAKDYANIVKGLRTAKDKILLKYTKKN
mgnify:CR=1 FL=1